MRVTLVTDHKNVGLRCDLSDSRHSRGLRLVSTKGACQITGQRPRWWVAVNPWLSVIVLVLCIASLAQAMKMR